MLNVFWDYIYWLCVCVHVCNVCVIYVCGCVFVSVLCVHISVGVCLSTRSVYIEGGTILLITCICAKTHITKQPLLIFVINMYTLSQSKKLIESSKHSAK